MAKPRKPVKLMSVLVKSKGGWHYIEVSAKIALRFETDPKTRRVVCTLNGAHTFQCALSPNKGVFTISVNAEIRKKLNLAEGDEVTVELAEDTSKYGAPMPEDFEEVLRQDPDGERLFHALTAGMQRSLIYLLNGIKNLDRRIHAGLIVLEHLKENNGTVIAERLNEDLKRPSQNRLA